MIQTIITYVNFSFPYYNDENYNECFFKSCLVYKYLCDTYFKKTIGINLIKYQLNIMVCLIDYFKVGQMF